jgi:aspartate-semialdehyde dehydrogenase
MVMFNVAIAGATGLVGEKVIRILEQRNFPVKELRLFASERSEGRKVAFRDKEYEVEALDHASFEGVDVAFFALSVELTKKHLPKARKHCLVIDKSSVYRLNDDVPLIVPEVNAEQIGSHKDLIATPNCTTIPLVVTLAPLHREFGLKRVILASYQSASGAGRDALDEYRYENEFVALRRPVEPRHNSPFPIQLADNVIPQIGDFQADGYGAEEHKTMNETRKIMELPGLRITATCVRVPTAVGHALSVVAEFEKAVTPKHAHDVLVRAPGLKLMNHDCYPTPVEVTEKDEVFVGRIRKDTSSENGLHLWIACDNLRKGAALNAVQIAELALKE